MVLGGQNHDNAEQSFFSEACSLMFWSDLANTVIMCKGRHNKLDYTWPQLE